MSCPQCGSDEHVGLLSTANEWRHVCDECDVRFNDEGEVMPSSSMTELEGEITYKTAVHQESATGVPAALMAFVKEPGVQVCAHGDLKLQHACLISMIRHLLRAGTPEWMVYQMVGSAVSSLKVAPSNIGIEPGRN